MEWFLGDNKAKRQRAHAVSYILYEEINKIYMYLLILKNTQKNKKPKKQNVGESTSK